MSEAPLPTTEPIPGANDMAYPVLDRDQTPNGTYQTGLTKRELFAAMAMQGILAGKLGPQLSADDCAEDAVMYANSLLQELAK